MDNLDQLQAKLDKILNPSMPEPVAIPEVKAQPINPMFYQIAAGMGNNLGAATMSPVEKDLRTLTPNQLYAKYGQQQADEMLGQLARASGELQRNNLAERDWGETAWDSTTGVANAFVGGLGSIAAYGAGKVNAEAGVGLSNVVESLRKFTEENQSNSLNARRKVGAVKDSLTQRDSDAQYAFDIQNGESKTVAGLAQIGRDVVNSSVFDDSMLLGQGTADAVGSFLTGSPIAFGIKGAAKLLVPKATARGIGLSGAMDAELGKWTVNRALSNADKLVWPAAIGALESGGVYQQTVEDATNTLKQQGKTVGDKIEQINDTGQQAADRMFLPAAALGTITRFGEKPFHVPNVKTAATNIFGREMPEETGQGAIAQLLGNQAIQDNIDPNRKFQQGVGDAIVQGAVYGSLAAGVAQGPGIAKQSVISAAKATLGYVDKRTALAAEKADDLSPVGTKALKEKASTLVPNSEPVKQTLAAELTGTALPDEEKDSAIQYANDVVNSLSVNLENEFDAVSPELTDIINGSEHRIDAIQQLAKKVITTSDPNDKLYTSFVLYQLLQPILDLQTNRPSAIDSLSAESQSVLKSYESLIANVNNSTVVKNAMKQVHDIMVEQGATVISPVLETELDTPVGNQKVQSIITAANIAPDQGNLDATESILKHAKEGKLKLTPEQTNTLNASVNLLRARKEFEEKNKQYGLNATDIVSSEILTDRGVKDNNARSATQYTQEILSAVRRGNTLGAAQLLNDMGLFVQHMKNKVEAINKHYQNGDPKASPVPYRALLAATRQWVDSSTNPQAIHKGGFVNTLKPDSIKFVQGVELEHKILADVYNSLTEVFPDLGIDRIEPLQLEKGISGAIRITTQEPTKPVVKEEPKPKVKVIEPKVKDNLVTEISSNAKGLGAALTNPTELAKSKGNIAKSYPVNFNGKTYRDAEEAYQKLKHLATKDSGPNSTYNLMVDIIKAKLEQHPSLVSEITKQGGSDWILSSTHQPTKKNTVWETGGKNWFIKALNEAYVSQTKPVVKTEEQPKVTESEASVQSETPATSTQTEPTASVATEPTKDTTQAVEALHEKAKLQDANIKPTENAEVLQEVDVVLPLVQQPVNLFEREDGSWSDDLLKAKKEIRELHEEELKKWGEVNKPIPKGSFIDSLYIAFNPISGGARIGLESTKAVDAALGLNVSLNALWALRLIFAKAYNSLQKSHAKKLKEKNGDYFSFRSKDDPKYKAHQEKLDALRQSVENAISTLKIALNALDKAILEKTKGTSEQSQDAVALQQQTDVINNELTQRNNSGGASQAVETEPVLEEIKPPKAFELNDGQKKAFDKIMSFLDGSGITFTLTGSAGTGKTTLVNTIIAALKKSGSQYGSVVLSAPTHRANAVTKSKNKNQKVMTLHQLLSLAPEVDLENFDASKVKFNQIEKEKDPFPEWGLIIIDESSMISDALYNFLMDKVSEFPDVKILFLGDAAQLRPVTKDNKPSLHDSKALTETDGQANLTKVERAKNPELLDESINLREKGSFTNKNNMKNSNGVAFTNSEAGFINRLIRMFKSQEFVDNRLLVRAVAYTNKRVTEINSKVRESLYGKDARDYVVGDLLMGYNRFGKQDDKGNLPIANGIDYLVTSVGSEKTIDILGVQVKTARITIKDVYGLAGSNTLTVILPSNDAAVWKALGEKFQKLSNEAYYAKDKSIFDDEANTYVFPKDLKALVTPRNTAIKPFETTLIKQTINYGYAHTIHKSQGGTYTYVFVDEPSILSTKDLDTRKRLRYVGMTRAEKGAYILTTSEITGEPITEAKFPVATSVTDLKDTPVKQEPIPVEPVVAETPAPKQTAPVVTNDVFTDENGDTFVAEQPNTEPTLDSELPTKNTTVIDNSPIVTGNKNAVIKVKPDVVVPSKFSKLVQGAANFFINSFKFKGKETTRTDDVESPLEFVRKALLNSESFQEVVPNSNYEMNKTVAKAYRGYLGQYYDELSNTLAKNLQDFLKVPNKKGVVRLNRINKGDPLHRYAEGKVLNLTEKSGDTYVYNQHLLELATLAGLQWFLTAGQTERRLEPREIAKLTGIPEGKLSNSLIDSILNTSDTGQLSQGLTNTIKSFWGVSGINTEMMAYTDGIVEAMAAEILRAFEELGMITKTSIYIDKTTNQQLIPDPNYYLKLQELENDEETKKKIKTVIRLEVNRFDNDALYSFPTAIQEVVLVESEDVTYFGDDIPPVPQTQLGDETIKLSRKEKKAVANANKTGVKTNTLQANILMSATEQSIIIAFGGGIENEHMNINTLASIQGKNKTTLNAYRAMVDMLSKVNNVAEKSGIDPSDVVMRFPHTITSVGRAMMLGKYNIQSSKLLREVFLPTWSTLDLQNNQNHYVAFQLGVAQALGIKVHNEGPNSITLVQELLSDQLSPAVSLVQDWMEATDNGNAEELVEFNLIELARIFKVAQKGLTPNAFHALVEYVRYQRTEDKTKFTTGLYLEADGVTNGPGNAIEMLTLGQFTAEWVTTVEKIGHSFGEPKAKHELDKNNPDLYKTGGINSVKHSQAVITKIKQSRDKQEIMQILGSLYSLLSMNVKGITYDPSKLEETGGVLANRDFFKNPLTILVYGSGIPGLAGKAARQMADNIYKRFSDANILLNSKEGKNLTVAQAMFPGDENAEQTYKKFVEDLNRIRHTTINTEYIDRKKVYVVEDVTQPERKYTKSELQKFTFSDSEIDAITQNITKGLVEAMYQGAVETVGKTVMQSSKMIQQATQIQSILLEAAFTKAIQDKIANHKASAKDTGYMNGDFISKQDFMDIMEELKVIAPYLKTPDQTFLAAKSGRYRNEKDEAIGYSLSLNSKYRTDPNMYIPTNAGVSGTPNLVIGLGDAYAILQAASDESMIGNLWIFDGINMPLDKILDYAPKLNKAAFEAWLNNALRVVEDSFRTFMGAESMMTKALNEALNNEDLADQLNKSLRLYKTEDKLSSGSTDYALSIFNDLLNELKNSADSIDARHAAIVRMANSVDQLAAAGVPWHNGVAVDPTLNTPEKIAEQLNKYYQEELDKIKNKPKAEPVKEMTPEEMDPITKDMLSNTVTDISSGVKILHAAGLFNLGKSINLSREQRKAYIQLVRSNKLDGYKVVFGSIEQIKKYREVYGYKFVDLDQETDNGFIDMSNKIIHLINPSVETLVHEMIHAATYGSVLNYYQNPSLNTKEVNEAIERTEGLMGEFLKLSPKELARLTPEARAAINNVKAAIEEPASNLDNSSAVVQAKALNEFMAWSLSNQELISTFRKVEMPAYLRIAKEVIDIIKKFFTFKDKVTGEIKEQDLTIPKDLFGNLLFNASIIINSAQPSLTKTMAETTLFHSGTAKHITELRNTLLDKVVLFLNNTGQPMNISLYNSGFGKTLTEAYDTVSSLTPIFGISGVEETTLNYVVAALSTEIQIDPLTIDGIQTLYGHAVVELAKQVDAGTYPKAKYDALIGRIGNPKIINGKSTLLPVFLGLGLIDTELRDALAKIDMPTKTKNTTGTLDAGLDNFFNKMLDGLFKALTGQRKANNVADALELLTERLTEIALKESRAINSPFNAPGNNADKANEWVSNIISKLGNKGLALGAKLETSNKLRVKQLGSAVTILSSLASETNGETVSRAAISIVNKTNAWKPFREFITDLTNRTESNALVYDLIKKVRAAVQQLRQNYRTEVPKKIAKKFTRVLSNDEWSNLFRSMAKTDLAALIDIMTKEEMLDLFTNPNSLNKQIAVLENRIQNQDKTNWSLYQTKMKQLANYMNTGITGSNFLRNPYAIHGLLNEAKPKNFKVMGKDAVHSIDQLTTLYAIEGLSQQDKTDMAEMIKEESEALGFIIDYLVGQSAGEVLKAANNPVIQLNYYKGHIPQINKSGSSLLVATDDQMHNLKLRGYTRIGDYAGSNIDPNRIDKGYYFSTVSGNTAVSQGTIQNIQKTISGVDDTYGFTVGSMVDRITDPAEVRRITLRLSKETNTVENLMPIFAASGEVIAYERSMNPEMIAMLKPSEHLAEMIGVWRGRQIEEQIATEINKEVIDNHYTMWKNDITKKPSSQQEYVNILDPKQLDVIEQDMVSLFSFETRQYIANTYGSEFWVRKDVMNDMIGYRKASVADVFTGKTRLSKETQEVIKKVLVTAFGYEAYKYAVNSEKFIQNVTNEVRTLIIVKSLIVPMFNIASNIVQAIARGVPIKTILKAPTKILELRSYTQSQVKQVGLEAELRAASGNPSQQKVLEAQIQAIKDGHKRLSIWPLIEAGEFSTISDIGSNSEDIDLFSGNSESWLRNKIDKLPPALKTTVRYGFITRDTALFQGLQKMVQYGDFIAKAVMYDDLMKRKGLTKEQALGKITDEFVNYDKLPGRARGYLEDMGVFWFWNYKLRITKVALSIMRENPINALMLSVMPIPIGSGTPMGDNFVTKLLDGSLTSSIGPGMSLQAAQLTPVYNILN